MWTVVNTSGCICYAGTRQQCEAFIKQYSSLPIFLQWHDNGR